MKAKKTEANQQRDRIDILVDKLDKYHFRIGSAENVLSDSTYCDLVGGVRDLFETAYGKNAKKLFYENLKEVSDPELRGALEETAISWQSGEETFPMILGFVLGLRIAGIDSERAQQMARTWRLGFPQDDEEESRHVRR